MIRCIVRTTFVLALAGILSSISGGAKAGEEF